MKKKILVSLITLSSNPQLNWQDKIKEIEKYNIEEIALFLTGLGKEERKKLYSLLSKTKVKSIPHIHIRNDMDILELDYLVNTYSVQALNLHSFEQFPLIYDYSKYSSIIYLENNEIIPSEKSLKKFGGLCVDFSHWENARLNNYYFYNNYEKLVQKFTVGCCHISAISDKVDLHYDLKYPRWIGYDHHLLKEINEVDYLKKYRKYLPKLISIELNNSIAEQLKIKKYIENKIIYG